MKRNEMAGNPNKYIAEAAVKALDDMAKSFGIKYSRAELRSACEGAVYCFNSSGWGRGPIEDSFGAYAAAVETGLLRLRDIERKEAEKSW